MASLHLITGSRMNKPQWLMTARTRTETTSGYKGPSCALLVSLACISSSCYGVRSEIAWSDLSGILRPGKETLGRPCLDQPRQLPYAKIYGCTVRRRHSQQIVLMDVAYPPQKQYCNSMVDARYVKFYNGIIKHDGVVLLVIIWRVASVL